MIGGSRFRSWVDVNLRVTFKKIINEPSFKEPVSWESSKGHLNFKAMKVRVVLKKQVFFLVFEELTPSERGKHI